MTDTNSNADNTATRPISVAELLAKNGSIGAPAPGGRRRRRRGNADAVTVAELTGEIPIVSMTDEPPAPAPEPPVDEVAVEAPTAEETAVDAPVLDEPEAEAPDEAEVDQAEVDQAEVDESEVVEPEAEPEPDAEEAAAVDAAATDYDAHLQQREAEPEPVAFQPRRRAHGFSRRTAEAESTDAATAEAMSPDPLLDDDGAGAADRPSYLKSPSDTLFGGDSVADEATRRTRTPGPEDIDLESRDLESGDLDRSDLDDTELLLIGDAGDAHEGSAFMRGLWVVVQSVLAVALGAGLFIAFDQLWKWNNIVALALSVLVILGLVVGVRVVRKTEDIASTLIAVAVGAMVTLGPLALLQST